MKFQTNPKWVRFTGYALNLAIFFLVLLLSGLLVRNYLLAKSEVLPETKIIEGEKISFPEFRPAQNTKTVFLFLYSQCIYCVTSKDFYRSLAEKTHGKENIKLVAVFPTQDENSENFLRDAFSVPVENKKIDFAAVGVFDTPTLVLADDNGNVNQVWKGKLSIIEEAILMNTLGLTVGETAADWHITEQELDKLLKNESVSVVDLREREFYKQAHHPKAVNIPFDELPVRAINELEQTNTIILDENLNDKKKIESGVKILNIQGYQKVLILKKPNPQR